MLFAPLAQAAKYKSAVASINLLSEYVICCPKLLS
jgi:hypothetical protein